MEDHYFRIGQTAKRLGISLQTVKMWRKTNKIQSTPTLGGGHRFSKTEINRILDIKLPENRKPVLYSRIASRDQLTDLVSSEFLSPQNAQILTGIYKTRNYLQKTAFIPMESTLKFCAF